MRKFCIIAILAVFFAGFVFSVVSMERLGANGTDVLLPLAPVDPRALLMGDYMTLDYAVNNAIYSALTNPLGYLYGAQPIPVMDGKAVVRRSRPQEQQPDDFTEYPVAAFVRLDDGTPVGEDEFLLIFKLRGARIITAAPAFYFQEGDASAYEHARYGRVTVGSNGKTLLMALCDEEGHDIKPERNP